MLILCSFYFAKKNLKHLIIFINFDQSLTGDTQFRLTLSLLFKFILPLLINRTQFNNDVT
jgi:hypothetical protein